MQGLRVRQRSLRLGLGLRTMPHHPQQGWLVDACQAQGHLDCVQASVGSLKRGALARSAPLSLPRAAAVDQEGVDMQPEFRQEAADPLNATSVVRTLLSQQKADVDKCECVSHV